MAMRTKNPAFALLQVANLSSGTANGVVMITVPWLVLESTGSAAKAGLIAALVSLPGIVVSPLVGGLIDRVGRRAISVISDFLSGVSVFLFVVVELFASLNFPTIAVLAILGATFDPAGYTARKGLIPNAAAASGIDADTANGRHEGIFAIGWMVGPALGALCISWSGPAMAFAFTAVLFVLAAAAVRAMRVRELHHEEDHVADEQSFFSSLRVGWQTLRGDHVLFSLTISFMISAALYLPIEAVVWPTYFEGRKDAAGLGAVFAAVACGVVVGSFSYGKLARRFTTHRLLQIIISISTIALLPMALLPTNIVFVALAFGTGLGWGPFNPLWNSVVQRRVEPRLHGRVYGLQMSLLYATPPLAQLIVGWGIDTFSLQSTLTAVLACFALLAMWILANPVFKQL